MPRRRIRHRNISFLSVVKPNDPWHRPQDDSKKARNAKKQEKKEGPSSLISSTMACRTWGKKAALYEYDNQAVPPRGKNHNG
jgi:hypothetical protein